MAFSDAGFLPSGDTTVAAVWWLVWASGRPTWLHIGFGNGLTDPSLCVPFLQQGHCGGRVLISAPSPRYAAARSLRVFSIYSLISILGLGGVCPHPFLGPWSIPPSHTLHDDPIPGPQSFWAAFREAPQFTLSVNSDLLSSEMFLPP